MYSMGIIVGLFIVLCSSYATSRYVFMPFRRVQKVYFLTDLVVFLFLAWKQEPDDK